MADVTRVIRIVVDASKAREGAGSARAALDSIQSAAQRLSGVLAAVFSVRQIAQWADSWKSASNMIRVVVADTNTAATVQQRLYEVSQRTRTEFSGLVQLYSRGAQAAEQLNASQSDLINYAQGVGQAIAISGRSTQQASGALLQLSQAMGSAIVRAEEFNSVNEGAPRILKAVADGLAGAGGNVARLRQMVLDGAVTNKMFFEAFMSQLGKLEDEYARTSPLIQQAHQNLSNAMARQIGLLDEASGASTGYANAVIGLASHLDDVATAATIAGAALAGLAVSSIITAIGGLSGALYGVSAALYAITAAAAANPIGLLIIAISAGIGALFAFRDEVINIGVATVHLGSLLKTTWDAISGAIRNTAMQLYDLLRILTNVMTLDFSEAKQWWAEFQKHGNAAISSVTGSLETYREHLRAAVVDAIALNTDSASLTGTNPKPIPFSLDENDLKLGKAATMQLQEFMESLRSEADVLRLAANEREEYRAILRATDAATRDYQEGLRDLPGLYWYETRAIRESIQEKQRLERAERDAATAAEELKNQLKAQADEIARIADRTTDRIVDGFADMLKGGKDSFRSLKEFALSMFREIAANAFIRPIIAPIVGSITGAVAGSSSALAAGGAGALGGIASSGALGFFGGAALGGAMGALGGMQLGGLLGMNRSGAKIGGGVLGGLGGLGAAAFMMGGGNPLIGLGVAGALALGGTLLGGLFGSRPSDMTQFSDLNLASGSLSTGGFTGAKFSQENMDAATRLGQITTDLAGGLARLSGTTLSGRAFYEVGSRDGILADINGTRGRFAHSEAGGGQAIGFVLNQIASGLGDALPATIREALQRADWSDMDAAAKALMEAIARAEYGKTLVDEINRQLEEAQHPFTKTINQVLSEFDVLTADAQEFGVLDKLEQLRDIKLDDALAGLDRDSLNQIIEYYSTVKDNSGVVAAARSALETLNEAVEQVATTIQNLNLGADLDRMIEALQHPFTTSINGILDDYDSMLPDASQLGIVDRLDEWLGLALEKALAGLDRDSLNQIIEYYSTVAENSGVVAAARSALDALNDTVEDVIDTFTGMTEVERAFVDSGLGAIDQFIRTLEDGIRDLQSQADRWRSLVTSTGDAWRALALDGNLSPLSPSARLQAAEGSYTDLRRRAALGDASAIEQLPGASRDYLQAARDMFGGSEEYFRRFQDVQASLQTAESVAERHLRIAEDQLESLKTQLTAAQSTRAVLSEMLDGQRVVITTLTQMHDIAADIGRIVALASQPRPVEPSASGQTQQEAPAKMEAPVTDPKIQELLEALVREQSDTNAGIQRVLAR